MRFVDIILLVLLFVLLWVSAYTFWGVSSIEPTVLDVYSINISDYRISNNSQFYPNMRYRSKEISYFMENICSEAKKRDVIRSFSILSNRTILRFYLTDRNPEIRILCSEVAPTPEEENHFVAGEGGPSEIINTSLYAVILSGKVSLYREEKCTEPKIALHEILHALGFDHNSNEKSIMYPVTNCNQELDNYIVEEINSIYSAPSYPELIIESISANRTGRYLSFDIVVGNYGLQDSANSSLDLYADSEKVKTFDLGKLEIGTRKFLTVSNVRIPRASDNIDFIIVTKENELSKENNRATVTLSDRNDNL